MSFPRAKRFTEKPSCGPPPGSYDPKFDAKVKGLVIEKSERFNDVKTQAAGAENPNSSLRSCSSSSLPVFRTPQPPKKPRERSQRSRSQTTGLQCPEKKDSATDTEDMDTQSDDGCFNCESRRRLRFDSTDVTFIEELSRDLKDCRSRCLSLEVANSELECEKSNLSRIKNEVTEELSKSKLSLQVSENNCCFLNNELEMKKQVLQAEKIKYEELKNSHDDEYKKFEESHRRLNETLKDLKQESEKLQCHWESQLSQEKALNTDMSLRIAQKQQMILMLQSELSSLEVEFEDFKAERDKMMSEHNTEKSALMFKYSKNIEKLEKQIEEIDKKHSLEKLDLEEQLRNFETDCTEYKMAKTSLEAVLSAKEMEVSELTAECEAQKAENAEMKLKHYTDFINVSEQFQNLEDTFSCINRFSEQCAIKLNEINSKYEVFIKHILQLHQNKVKELENYRVLQMESIKRDSEKTISDLEECVLVLKKDKAGTEKNLALKTEELHRISDALTLLQNEISQITATRDELRVSNVDQQLTIVELQDKLDSVTVEHNLCKQSLGTLKCSLEASEDQNRKFEVGNRNLRDSLHALGLRLLESENYVEQLTATRNQLEAEKAVLITEMAGCMNKLISQEEEMKKVEEENLRQIEQIRNELLQKVDIFKCKAVLKSQNMPSLRHDVDSFASQLSVFKEKLHKINEYVEQLEGNSQEKDANIQELQTRLQVSEKLLLETQSSLEQQAKSYEERVSDLEDALKQSEAEMTQISDLETLKTTKEKEIKEAESNIINLQSEITSKDETIRELKSEFNEFRDKYCLEKFVALERKLLSAENNKLKLITEIQKVRDDITGSLLELSTNKLLLEEKTHGLEKLQVTIQEMQNILNDKQHDIDCLSRENDALKQYKALSDNKLLKAEQGIEFLKLSVTKLEADSKDKVEKCKLVELEDMVAELRAKLASADDHFNRQLQEYEERALRSERQCTQLEDLVGPFRKQLESFLAERGEILRGKGETEDELKNLAMKYAHLLGHQNHKQKVKYVVQLQEKNLELREEVEKLRSQARAQKIAMEKLKSELTASARKKGTSTTAATTTTAVRQILKNRDNSPGKKPPKGKDGGDVSPVRHVPVGKENSPAHGNFVRSKENGSSKMLPVVTSTPKLSDRGSNA